MHSLGLDRKLKDGHSNVQRMGAVVATEQIGGLCYRRPSLIGGCSAIKEEEEDPCVQNYEIFSNWYINLQAT